MSSDKVVSDYIPLPAINWRSIGNCSGTGAPACHGSPVACPGAPKHSDSGGETRKSRVSNCDVRGRSDGTHREYPAASSEHVAAGLLSLSSVST